MLSKKLFFNICSLLLTILAVIFGFVYLGGLIDEARSFDYSINPLLLLISLAIFLLFYWILSKHWLYLSNVFKNTNPKQDLAFYASQPYKYLPTSIFTFSFRAKYSKQLGMSIKSSSLAQLLENINLLGIGAYTALLFYLLSINILYGSALLVGTIFIMFIIPDKINLSIRAKKLTINKYIEIKAVAMVFLAWIVSGLSFYVLNKGLGINIGLFDAISANSAAYSLGILAFFAPGGIGIREWVFSVFGIASISIVFWRILTFAVDMAVGVITILIIEKKSIRSGTEVS